MIAISIALLRSAITAVSRVTMPFFQSQIVGDDLFPKSFVGTS
jgi:hypothetical protein